MFIFLHKPYSFPGYYTLRQLFLISLQDKSCLSSIHARSVMNGYSGGYIMGRLKGHLSKMLTHVDTKALGKAIS